jgi:hypothetical protein
VGGGVPGSLVGVVTAHDDATGGFPLDALLDRMLAQ